MRCARIFMHEFHVHKYCVYTPNIGVERIEIKRTAQPLLDTFVATVSEREKMGAGNFR